MKNILIFTLILIVSATVSGQEDQVLLTLNQAVTIAYEKNLNLVAMRSQVEASSREKDISRANFFPRIDVEQSFMRTDQQVGAFGTTLNQGKIQQSDFNPDLLNNPDTITDFGTIISVSQPIFNGGAEILGYKLSGTGYNRSLAELDSATEEILFETVRAYLGAVLAKEGHRITTKSLATGEKNLEMIRQRFDQGLVIKSDLLQTQVHVANLREQEVTARHQSKIAIVGFNTILGNATGLYGIEGTLDHGSCPDIDLEILREWALRDHPDIRKFNYQKEAADLMIKMAQSSFLPNINGRGIYEYHGGDLFSDGADSVTLALSLKLNLFNGTGDYHRVGQAKRRMETARYMLESTRNMVSLGVEKSYYELQSAENRIQTMTDAVGHARESLRILENRYEEGAAGIVDLLVAELALSGAEFNLTHARHDLLLGNASLCKSIGHLYSRLLEPDKCPVDVTL